MKSFAIGALTGLFLLTLISEANAFSLPAMVDQATQLQEEGNYAEAQKIYEKILEAPGLSREQMDHIQKQYEELNIKMLFSRFPSSESFFHEVQKGESLYTIAQKYNTTVDLIKKSNGLFKDTIYPGMKLKIIQGTFSVLIDKSENQLILRLGGKTLKHYRVATGKDNGTPAGTFKIVNKLQHPTWYRTGAVVPPDSPENILGTRWMGFDFPGYGIHGTTEPDKIGQHVTAGCVRMRNEDVEELFAIVPQGTEVAIVD